MINIFFLFGATCRKVQKVPKQIGSGFIRTLNIVDYFSVKYCKNAIQSDINMANLPLKLHHIVQSRNIAKIFWNLQKPGVTFQCHAAFSSVSCRKQRNASLTRNHIIHERIQHLSSHPIPNEHSYHVGHSCTRCQAFRQVK